LWRDGVKPGNKECETIARDAGIKTGFAVATSEGRTSSKVYRLITPLPEDADCATLELCPHCEERTLIEIPDGMTGEFCPLCANRIDRISEPQPAQLEQPQTPIDWRPGKPLERVRDMRINQLYHFFAFGALFTASVQVRDDGNKIAWAAQQALEGPHGGYQEGRPSEFELWFAQYAHPMPAERAS
jgi:hypothetical protein